MEPSQGHFGKQNVTMILAIIQNLDFQHLMCFDRRTNQGLKAVRKAEEIGNKFRRIQEQVKKYVEAEYTLVAKKAQKVKFEIV